MLSVVYYYYGVQRYEQFLYRSVDCIGFNLVWFSYLFPSTSVSLWCYIYIYIYIYIIFCLHPSLYLLLNWAWWYWSLTWLTNHRPLVSNGMANPTVPVPVAKTEIFCCCGTYPVSLSQLPVGRTSRLLGIVLGRDKRVIGVTSVRPNSTGQVGQSCVVKAWCCKGAQSYQLLSYDL